MQIDGEPIGEQHHLGGHGRTVGIRHLAQQRQIELRETVDGPRPTGPLDGGTGTTEGLAVLVVASDLQRQVGLDAGTDIDRTAGMDGPAAAWKLLVENALNGAGYLGPTHPAGPGEEQDVFAFQDRVAFERGPPMAVRGLSRQQPRGRGVDRREYRSLVDRLEWIAIRSNAFEVLLLRSFSAADTGFRSREVAVPRGDIDVERGPAYVHPWSGEAHETIPAARLRRRSIAANPASTLGEDRERREHRQAGNNALRSPPPAIRRAPEGPP